MKTSRLLATSIAIVLSSLPCSAHDRIDAAFDAIVDDNAPVELLTSGYGFTEGPVWMPRMGVVLFSDLPGNVVHQFDPRSGKASVYLLTAGFTGPDPWRWGGMSNKRDGSIYFTDTFGGLRKRADDPRKEIPINAVYRWKDGSVDQLVTDMPNTNGLAFSPDETLFYVNASRDNYIRVYDVHQDGTLANGRMFAHLRGRAEKGVTDGMKVDSLGNVYVTGPGGIWIITSAGQHVGTIQVPEVPISLAFGDEDRKSLYITAHTGLYRLRVRIAGL